MRLRVEELEFDDWNEQECFRHHVTPREIREVLDERPVFVRNKRPHAATILMIGPTNAGRFLTVPLAQLAMEGVWRPATAWDSDADEVGRYHAFRRRPD